MAISVFRACTLYFCFQLFHLNSRVNLTPSTTGNGFCEDGYRLPLVSEVVAVYDMGGHIAENLNYTFLVLDSNSKVSILNMHTGNDTIGGYFHVLKKQYMNEYVSHKICVMSAKPHAEHHAVFTVVAMMTMAIFGAIIVVYLLVLFCCLCRRLSSCNGDDE